VSALLSVPTPTPDGAGFPCFWQRQGAPLSICLTLCPLTVSPRCVPILSCGAPPTQGQVSIAELAEQLQLPTSIVSAAVSKRLGSILQAELRGSTLFTQAFLQREAGRVRGAFIAHTKCVGWACTAGCALGGGGRVRLCVEQCAL
jgi:hypothetical protein